VEGVVLFNKSRSNSSSSILEPFKKSLNITPLHLGVTTWFVELKDGNFGAISIAQFEK
jgi:hypothetical protein